METLTAIRRRMTVRGVVQGVGFRPFVARLADQLDLTGNCRNDATCVVLEVEGDEARVAEFRARLSSELPPLAHLLSIVEEDVAPTGETSFLITESTAGSGGRTMVPPDTAPCDDCLTEFFDPRDRRFHHPFITCTNCGPRFTITTDLPYDRPNTSMADFAMCGPCAQEYADPSDRRYHAQPISCHDCGPTLAARHPDGSVAVRGTSAVVELVAKALGTGAIVAIKGVGGYHLVCDATSEEAVRRLRHRKNRPHQPFAVMAADQATAERLVRPTAAGLRLLLGKERPILLAPAMSGHGLAAAVAPGLAELGVMLPYTPLHHLLFAALAEQSRPMDSLVMTSGNLSGEPLCFSDEEAVTRLGALVELFLTHDREVIVPCEDSVFADSLSGPIPIRRSRGFAPLPIALRGPEQPVVLAVGADLKNTFALSRNGFAFISAHVGDLGTLESRAAHERATDQLLRFHDSTPEAVVADLHPGYFSRAWAATFASTHNVPLHEVQHHHAHLASLAAEHGRLGEPIIGAVFDGTGYGCDRTIWGGEFLQLAAAPGSFERVGHLGDVRLLGGDAGVRNPVRTAAMAMVRAGVSLDGTAVGSALTDQERQLIARCLASGAGQEAVAVAGAVSTTSMGRLFDVASSMLGVRHRITYEAQAAIELEALATRWAPEVVAPDLVLPIVDGAADGPLVLGVDALVSQLAALIRELPDAIDNGSGLGAAHGAIALAFHQAVARATAELLARVANRTGVHTVGLSGGVFANRLLLNEVCGLLQASDLEVLTHRVVPPGDGGVSLGQVALGALVVNSPTWGGQRKGRE